MRISLAIGLLATLALASCDTPPDELPKDTETTQQNAKIPPPPNPGGDLIPEGIAYCIAQYRTCAAACDYWFGSGWCGGCQIQCQSQCWDEYVFCRFAPGS